MIIVDILCNWYSKLFFAVRWNGELSAYFAVGIVALDRAVACRQPFLMFL